MRSLSDSIRLVLLSLALLCGSLLPALLHAEVPAISVAASASVRYEPDTAEFTTSLSATENDASKAAAKVARLWSGLQQSLRAAGIAAQDASSISYSVNPEWEWNRATGSRSLKGYTARHTVRVVVRDLRKLGAAIDVAAGAGAGSIEGLRYTSSRFEHFRAEALADAVRSARQDAEVMARAAGGRLGTLLSLDYGQPQPDYPVMRAVMAAAPEAAAPVTELEPAGQKLTVSVNSRWQFVSGKGK
ncbi:MAG: SIMPL domain-containing protein [Chlorobiaceae bacterium]|nr:SIMPL domain-containing protein [Chlorobiaceae bacterium]